MTLLSLTLALAILQALIQGFDLWSTSEILKRKLGVEGNPRMVGITASYAKFATVKGFLALLGFIFPAIAYYWPTTTPAMAIMVGALNAYYLPIMQSNYNILKGKA